jgi:hypothetical protein
MECLSSRSKVWIEDVGKSLREVVDPQIIQVYSLHHVDITVYYSIMVLQEHGLDTVIL